MRARSARNRPRAGAGECGPPRAIHQVPGPVYELRLVRVPFSCFYGLLRFHTLVVHCVPTLLPCPGDLCHLVARKAAQSAGEDTRTPYGGRSTSDIVEDGRCVLGRNSPGCFCLLLVRVNWHLTARWATNGNAAGVPYQERECHCRHGADSVARPNCLMWNQSAPPQVPVTERSATECPN